MLDLAWASIQMFSSRALGQAAGIAVIVIVARELGPGALGLYSVALVIATLLADVPGAGLDLCAVRLSSRDGLANPPRARGVLLIAGLTKAAWGVIVAALALALADPVARLIGRPELALPLRFAAVAGVAVGMTEYVLAALQAQERFRHILAVSLVAAALRLGPVVVLVLGGALTLPSALVAVAAGAYGSAAVGALLAWRVWRGPVQRGREPARELFTLARWLVLATLIGAVSNSLDTVTLAQLAGPEATGMYTSGRSLALPLLLAGGAVGAVLLPRLSRLASSGELGSQVRRTSLAVAGGAALLAVGSVAVGPALVPLVYGDRYAEAVVVFQLLALSYCVQIATWPALAVLLVLDRPDVIAALSFVGLCLMGVGYVVAVPRLGAVGAAWVGLAGPAIMAGPWAFLAWSSLRPTRRSTGMAMTPGDALPDEGKP